MKKKLLCLFAILFSLVSLCALAACGGNKLKITPSSCAYDIGTGGDLVVDIELNGEKIIRVKDGDSVVDPTEYLAGEKKLTVFETYMLYLETGEHTFTVATEKREGSFTVNVTNNIVTSFDTSDKTYAYGSENGVAIDADLSTARVVSVKAGPRKLKEGDFTYDGTAHRFTISNEYCRTLYGTTQFTVSLSNNTEYKFNVVSDCMFAANFDDDYIPSFYNDHPGILAQGWNGTKALHWYGNGGNLMLFTVKNQFSGNMVLNFDPEKIYELQFKFKNNWKDEGDPVGFVNMDVNNSTIFRSNYLTGQCDGGVATVDENGVWNVKIYFKGCEENKFSIMYTGYDGGRPDKKLYDLLFDDIVLIEAKEQAPVFADTEKSVPRGSSEGDVWFDGVFGLHRVTSVKVGEQELSAANYTAAPSSFVLKQAYVNSLTADTVYTVTFENGDSETLTLKMGRSLPTSFDPDTNRTYTVGAGDVSYEINLRDFSILHLKNGEQLVPETAYEIKEGRLFLKQAYLDTLVGENHFVLTVDNAGQVEGKDEADVHRFCVASNAVANFRFDDEAAGTPLNTSQKYGALIGATSATKSEIAGEGITGNSWNLAATGGNFMAMKGPAGAWTHGAFVVSLLEADVVYNLSFDIKLLAQVKTGGEFDYARFVLYTTSGSPIALTFDTDKALTAADGATVTDKGNGVYNVSVRLTYSASAQNGCIRLEALGYNEINYDILLDNIVITRVPLASTALYVYGSQQDVAFNVTFDAVKSVTVNGETLSSDLYTLADGQFIVKAEYAQTVIGSVELSLTLDDNSVERLILQSTRMQVIDFEGAFDVGGFCIGGFSKCAVVEEGISGKSWNIAGSGGNFMTFAPQSSDWVANRLFPACVTDFQDGLKYTLSFDVKLVGQYKHGTTDAPEKQLVVVLHGTEADGRMYFDNADGILKADSGSVGALTITAKGNGVYGVSYEFTYRDGGANMGCVGLEADSYNEVDYEFLFDNIEVMQKI